MLPDRKEFCLKSKILWHIHFWCKLIVMLSNLFPKLMWVAKAGASIYHNTKKVIFSSRNMFPMWSHSSCSLIQFFLQIQLFNIAMPIFQHLWYLQWRSDSPPASELAHISASHVKCPTIIAQQTKYGHLVTQYFHTNTLTIQNEFSLINVLKVKWFIIQSLNFCLYYSLEKYIILVRLSWELCHWL